MRKSKRVNYDEAMVEHYRKHPEELRKYLEIALEEYQKDDDEKAFLSALSLAAKAKGGFSRLSKDTGLSRESLYKALSEHRDPRLSTIKEVITSLGYVLKIA